MRLHLCPTRSHVTPSATLLRCSTSTLLSNGRRCLKMMQSGTAARLRLVSRPAAVYYSPWEFAPEEDDPTVIALKPTLFPEELKKITSYAEKIKYNKCIMYNEARLGADIVSYSVQKAANLSTSITANARQRIDESSSEISFQTIDQIVGTYVSTFLEFIKDIWHRNVDNEKKILSYFRALSGLAAVSHIMFEDTLAAVNINKEGSLIYIPKCNVEELNHAFQHKMQVLELNLMEYTSVNKANTLIVLTLSDASDHLYPFVMQMIRQRNKALAHARARGRDAENTEL